jgi:hypothetical protein
MSAPTRTTPRTVRLSVWLYSRLLVAYPQPFRQEYGGQMSQVFRDCCREAAATNGNIGLTHYWLIAFGDLVVSALAERRQEELHMTRALWIRIGSLSAIIGGGIAAVFAGLSLTIAVAQLLDQRSPLGAAMVPVRFATWAAPALTLLFVFALIGLQVRGAGRMGILGWVSITIAILGLAIYGLGTGVISVVSYSQSYRCGPLNCSIYDPDNFLLMGFMAGMLGSLVFAIGLIIYGTVALRRRILPQRNFLPLLIGATGLLDTAASFISTITSTGIDFAGLMKVEIMSSIPALAFAIIWILLGLTMRPRGDAEAPAQNVSTPIEPAI